ncbi:MAG: hypothetical protein MUC36_22565 [Planctomycetes bacterium]|jgi:cytochrome c peroxidase|nr:hypothetical protein [Planctomycetota bacterium]
MSIASAIVIALAFASPLAAQQQHVAGLVGDMPPDLGNWPAPASPDGNKFVRSTAPAGAIARRDRQAALGKAMFWDEQCSSNNTIACGTCHLSEAGGTDNRPGAVFLDPTSPDHQNFGAFGVIRQSFNGLTSRIDYGFQVAPSTSIDRLVTPVAAPTMIGAYLFERLFWDMRAGPQFHDNAGFVIPNFTDWAALEDLAVEPAQSPVEMAHETANWASGFLRNKLNRTVPLALVNPATIPPDVAAFLATFPPNTSYATIFDSVFGGHPQFGGAVGVTRERFALAIAHYHRKLIPDQAPIDRGTMTLNQVAGFNFLKTNSSCFACHSVSGNPTLTLPGGVLANPFDNLFSDGRFHQIGVTPTSPPRKTPTLRNIGLHRKFFSTGHGGDGITKVFVTNFAELVKFYDLQPGFLGINGSGPGGTMTAAETNMVTDFLSRALTDPRVASRTFPFDRPTLRSEAVAFESNEYGVGTAGPSALVPEIIANVPEKIVAPGMGQWFKIGVGRAPANRAAKLLIGTAAAGGPVLVGGGFTSLVTQPTNAQGITTVHVPFPLTAVMIGIPVFTQWVVDDFGVSAFSDAARFVPY